LIEDEEWAPWPWCGGAAAAAAAKANRPRRALGFMMNLNAIEDLSSRADLPAEGCSALYSC
jgi:hypothetical protein